MTSRNDVTGDSLKTKPSSNEYRSNWDAIFGKKKEQNETTKEEKK